MVGFASTKAFDCRGPTGEQKDGKSKEEGLIQEILVFFFSSEIKSFIFACSPSSHPSSKKKKKKKKKKRKKKKDFILSILCECLHCFSFF